MKTTIDLADDLLMLAKEAAREHRTTLKSIMEDALRSFLPQLRSQKKRKKLKLVTFRGNGLTAEAQRMTPHERILALYENDRP